jgi:hypothetical protein
VVSEIELVLCTQFARDVQRLAHPIRIPLPALEARDQPVFVVGGVVSKEGE